MCKHGEVADLISQQVSTNTVTPFEKLPNLAKTGCTRRLLSTSLLSLPLIIGIQVTEINYTNQTLNPSYKNVQTVCDHV